MGCNSSNSGNAGNPQKVASGQKSDVIVLLGAPGIGKTTQALKLVHNNGFFHVAPEELVRQEIGRVTELGKELKEHQANNREIPANSLALLVSQRLKEIAMKSPHARVVLENFPNCQEHLDQWKEKQLNNVCNLKHVLYLSSTEKHSVPRLLLHPNLRDLNVSQEEKEKRAKESINKQEAAQKAVLELHKTKLLKVDAAANIQAVFVAIQRELLRVNFIKLTPEQKPEIIFILGGPGSGKGTQCNKIKEKYKVHHYSTGDLLREEVKKDSPEARQLKETMDQGKLVSSDTLVKLLKSKIEEVGLGSKMKQVILLDGFPRGQDNINSWKSQGLPSVCEENSLLYFECAEETMLSRMTERAKTSGRSDDNPETMKKRLDTFSKETKPAIAHYEKLGKVIKVNAERGPDEIFKDADTELNKKVKFALNKRPNVLFVFGGPGAGKGTQCKKLSDKHGFIHFSAKKLVAEEVGKGGQLGYSIKQLQDEKKSVSDDLVVEVIRKNILEHWGNQKGKRLGFIIDGYPKNMSNISAWEKAHMELVCKVKTLMNIDATPQVLFERIKRNPSKEEKGLTEEAIKKRISDYQASIAPVVQHYEKLGLLTNVDAEGSTQQNFEEIEALLKKLKYI